MTPAIESHTREIAELCRRFGVRRLDIFGSGARGHDFDPRRSDADFLVEFASCASASPLEQFFGFAEALERLLDRPVDLVERGAVRNPYVLAEIERARELVYAA